MEGGSHSGSFEVGAHGGVRIVNYITGYEDERIKKGKILEAGNRKICCCLLPAAHLPSSLPSILQLANLRVRMPKHGVICASCNNNNQSCTVRLGWISIFIDY